MHMRTYVCMYDHVHVILYSLIKVSDPFHDMEICEFFTGIGASTDGQTNPIFKQF